MSLTPTKYTVVCPNRPLGRSWFLSVTVFAMIIALSSCSRIDPSRGTPMAPSLIITDEGGQPMSGPISGAITISVFPIEDIQKVQFVINRNRETTTIDEAPFDLEVDTRDFPDGELDVLVTVWSGSPPSELVLARTFDIRNNTQSQPSPSVPNADDALLTWAPPHLVNPVTVHVPLHGGVLNLDTGRDYQVVMPNGPVTGGVSIRGGRNVVLIGGEIAIPNQHGDDIPESARRGLFIRDNAGVVHIEGLYIHGEDLGEGIQISAKNSVVQIQNVRIWGIHARDQVNFSDGHPDLIQTWGNVGELRIDKLTGKSDYQGFFFKADMNGRHGNVTINRVNVHGDETARYLFWMSDIGGGYPVVSLDEFYVQPAPGRSFGKSVWPDVGDHSDPATVDVDAGTGLEVASWNSLPVSGHVIRGQPANGDFVPASEAGIGYSTPGYL